MNGRPGAWEIPSHHIALAIARRAVEGKRPTLSERIAAVLLMRIW